MLEVQALTNERAESSEGGMTAPPIRTAVGLRFERMQLLLAVLAKFVLGRRVQKHDIFINIVGGMKLDDPSTDVAIALAIASSFVEKPLPPDMCFFGEVGLGGELRPVMQAERRSPRRRRWVSSVCSCPKREVRRIWEKRRASNSCGVTRWRRHWRRRSTSSRLARR